MHKSVIAVGVFRDKSERRERGYHCERQLKDGFVSETLGEAIVPERGSGEVASVVGLDMSVMSDLIEGWDAQAEGDNLIERGQVTGK